MGKEIELSELKVQILLHTYDGLAAWVRDRRRRADMFFSWTNSVPIAIIAALLVVVPRTADPILDAVDKIAFFLAVLLLAVVSHIWQKRSYDQIVGRVGLLSDIQDRLHLWDSDYFGGGEPILGSRHQNRILNERVDALLRRLGFNLYTIATWLMAVLTFAVIWTR
jgi:hypothetical protein